MKKITGIIISVFALMLMLVSCTGKAKLSDDEIKEKLTKSAESTISLNSVDAKTKSNFESKVSDGSSTMLFENEIRMKDLDKKEEMLIEVKNKLSQSMGESELEEVFDQKIVFTSNTGYVYTPLVNKYSVENLVEDFVDRVDEIKPDYTVWKEEALTDLTYEEKDGDQIITFKMPAETVDELFRPEIMRAYEFPTELKINVEVISFLGTVVLDENDLIKSEEVVMEVKISPELSEAADEWIELKYTFNLEVLATENIEISIPSEDEIMTEEEKSALAGGNVEIPAE